MILLQTINKYLRWTGFRLAVQVSDLYPVWLGLRWFGWGFLRDGTLFNCEPWRKVDGIWIRNPT